MGYASQGTPVMLAQLQTPHGGRAYTFERNPLNGKPRSRAKVNTWRDDAVVVVS